jgi:hypothetical protein
MFNIEKYLQKFSKSIQSTEDDLKKVLEIILKHTEIVLKPEEVEIKNYVINIKSSNAVKNKIFIYKEKILKELGDRVITKITDIK